MCNQETFSPNVSPIQGVERVEWEITAACDLSCAHCYSRTHRPRPGEASVEEAQGFARQLVKAGVRAVALSGGEPTLRSDLPSLVATLARGGVVPTLLSNGQRLDAPLVATLAATGLAHVQLSLDGLGATHDRIRRCPGAFRQVLVAASHLRAAGISFGFTTTVLTTNLHDLEGLARLAREEGAALFQVWLGLPRHRGAIWLPPRAVPELLSRLEAISPDCPSLALGDNLGYHGTAERLRRVNRLDRLRGSQAGDGGSQAGNVGSQAGDGGSQAGNGGSQAGNGGSQAGNGGSQAGNGGSQAASRGSQMGARGSRLPGFGGCEAGRRILWLRSDGEIGPCPLMDAPSLGRLGTEPLEAIAARGRQGWEARRGALGGLCGGCGSAHLCGGGCHGAVHWRGGQMENPYCVRVARRQEAPLSRRLARVAQGMAVAATLAAGCGASSAPTRRTVSTQDAGASVVVDAAPRPVIRADVQVSPPPADTGTGPSPDAALVDAMKGRNHPSNLNPHGLPSCCLAHILVPGCECGGPPIPSNGSGPDKKP